MTFKTPEVSSALEAIRDCRPSARGRLDEFLFWFSSESRRFSIDDSADEIDEAVAAGIESFLPMRDHFIRVITAAARFDPEGDWIIRVHRFFERMLPLMYPSSEASGSSKFSCDNFKFIVHELFLYTIAILMMFEKYHQAGFLFSERYYSGQGSVHGAMQRFDEFHKHIGSLEQRNERLGIGSESLRADLLRERCRGSGVSFDALMQADFTIFLRAELDTYPRYSSYWPELLMFLEERNGAFEAYIRARTEEYFDRLRHTLGIMNPDDLQQLIGAYEDESRRMPRGMKPTSVGELIGYQFLSTTRSR